MPILSTVGAASARGFGLGGAFSPSQLFIGGAVGAWYDPGDISTLFQDSARTTAVTTFGQPVGSILDKSGRGNHLIQATSASRPTWEARVNLLERTEELNNAAWTKTDASITTNATTAPDGTTTADKVVVNTNSVVTRHEVAQGFSGATTVVFQFSFYAKKSEITKVIGQLGGTALAAEIEFDLNAGTSTQVYVSNVSNVAHSITALSDNWYLCKMEAKSTSTNAMNRASVFHDSIGNGTNGWFLWGCDVRLASNNAFPYQKVVSATDYADVAAPRYLRFDGTDDGLYTASSINFTSTDKITAVTGMQKRASSPTICTIAEISSVLDTNNGSFGMFAPNNTDDSYSVYVRGASAVAGSSGVTTYPAPSTNVFTAEMTLAGPVIRGRVNGTQTFNVTSPSIGGGNFGNYVLYVGRRNAASLPMNGHIHQLIILGNTVTSNTLNNLERWVASRTGVSW